MEHFTVFAVGNIFLLFVIGHTLGRILTVLSEILEILESR